MDTQKKEIGANMKKHKGLIVLSVVFVVLLAIYIGVVLSGSSDDSSDSTQDDTDAVTYPVASIDAKSLTKISYTYLEKTYSFVLNDDGSAWLWKEDPDLILSVDKFTYMINAFTNLSSSVMLENVTDSELTAYGLNTPTAVIRFSDSVNGELCFNIGIKNTYNGMYYINEASSPSNVYMVEEGLLSKFKYTPDDMLQHDTLPTLSLSNVISVKVEGTENIYLYVWHEDEAETGDEVSGRWQLAVNGGEASYPGDEINGGLSQAVTEMEFKDFITYDSSKLAEYGLDDPIKITLAYREKDTSSGKYTETSKVILLGKESNDGLFYAKLEGSPYVYTLSPAIFGILTDAENVER